jgi:hypothetical protein
VSKRSSIGFGGISKSLLGRSPQRQALSVYRNQGRRVSRKPLRCSKEFRYERRVEMWHRGLEVKEIMKQRKVERKAKGRRRIYGL